jgi:hypothetical protein
MGEPKKVPAFKTSGYAMLDVTTGRKALAKWFEDAPHAGPTPTAFRIPVTIKAEVVGVWGSDDGISQEFDLEVSSLVVGKPKRVITGKRKGPQP